MNLRCSALTFRVVAVSASLLAMLSPAARAERLPKTVIPSHYALTLAPDIKAATFTGLETIDVDLKEPSKTITLNSAEIAFQSVTVEAAGKELTAAVTSDAEKEESTFTFPETLPAGPATLTVHYTGILNDKLRGFYLSKTDKRSYAVTQFESTDARPRLSELRRARLQGHLRHHARHRQKRYRHLERADCQRHAWSRCQQAHDQVRPHGEDVHLSCRLPCW